MASTLSRSRFFFMRNASVLNTVKASSLKNFTLASSTPLSMTGKSSILSSANTKGLFQSNFKSFASRARRSITTSAINKNTISISTSTTTESNTEPKTKSRKRPLINSSSSVGYWLIGTSGLVFGIVVLGGLTRLTESGLSITEWKPVTGAIPPLNEDEWIEEFNKYKESPEFKQINAHITLEEFKFIFFMEWAHRLVGRTIGAVLLIPAIYFAATRKTSARINNRLVILTMLLGLQGAIGWWMVKSGLDEEQLEERRSKPTVSQYRLTTHLAAAFVLYLGMVWTGLEILRENRWIKDPKKSLELFQQLDNPALRPLRRISIALLGLTFLTAMSGGMVAGLDAGLIYNTFPHMGDNIVPSKRELFDDNFARKEDKSDKVWRNLLENPTTVQLVHRILATTTFFSVLAAHMYAIKMKHVIPRTANKAMHGMMGFVTLQVALGITTLLYLVPIPLASAHQAGALALLTSSLVFASRLRKPRAAIRVLTSGLYAQQLKKAKEGSKILSEVSKLAK
ncbi:Cytochrome c oxidase assembly protein COX15 [Cyberlindnera fabianii]|uniref:Cytochrome c oxidase assembly protein COX15 n=1 Tax=Cyberlindnera fabianii TaxID=36022 RepID=A0A1V2L9Y5_CYBFA|nr:Cytochrome c oxidase assembly protein COX15 [Cyberlindnera fabianii]